MLKQSDLNGFYQFFTIWSMKFKHSFSHFNDTLNVGTKLSSWFGSSSVYLQKE